MIHLVAAIACSLAIGAVFKHAGQTGMDPLRLLTINYLTATVTAGLLLLGGDGDGLEPIADPGFLAFCLAAGAVLVGGFFIFAVGVARAGMSVTMAVMRVGVSIPFLASWLVWNEIPTPGQWAGLAMVVAALWMITRRHEAVPKKSAGALLPVAGVLLAVYVGGGLGDLTFKSFDVWFGREVAADTFLGLAFGVCLVVSSAAMGLRQRKPASATTRREALWGVILGLVNYGSVLFILGAVSRLPGPLVFPTHAVSVVVGGALIGVLIWRERLSRLNLAGVGVAAAAVLLLNL